MNVLRQLRMHVCRYDLRGPLATSRLTQGPEGSRVYTLKQPKADGTTQLACSPQALLQRLAQLLPQPRMHLTRSHGILASAHPLRSRVVPSPPQTSPPSVCGRKSRWVDWATLLKRVFLLDVLACVCGGQRRALAVIRDLQVARKILEHLGLPSKPLPPGRVEEPPQREFWGTGPPCDGDVAQVPAPEDFDQRVAEPQEG